MVLSGIDRLDQISGLLSEGRVGLMTNQTGISRGFRSTIDLLREKTNLTALFAVEHGIRGSVQAGEKIEPDTDRKTGLTVWPVYGETHRLTREMLEQFDIFCFDMQDVGARFYTYLYALSFAMEECAGAGKPVIVFDRINPLGGEMIQGTVLDPRFSSYVGMYPIPTRYGLTIGEYALWVKDYLKLEGLGLHVVPLSGWKRSMAPEETGLPWPAPSPNCPTWHAALLYAGTCIFEGTNVSEGRGTAMPFEYIGAPWLDGEALADRMNGMETPGIRFRPVWFKPAFSKYTGETCSGVQIHVTDPRKADPVRAALILLDEIREKYPDLLSWTGSAEAGYHLDRLLGRDEYRRGGMNA